VKNSFLNSPFTRLWTRLFWRSLQHTYLPPQRHLWPACCSARRLALYIVLGLVHNTACLLALVVMQTTAAGMKRLGAYVQT